MSGPEPGPGGPPGRAVRLVLDASRCDGHGICALRCPDLVALDRFGFAGVADDPITDVAVHRRACRAVAACPEGALTIVGAPADAAGGGRRAPWPPARGRPRAES